MDLLQRLEGITLCVSIGCLFVTATSFITFTNPDDRKDFPDREVLSQGKPFTWTAAWPTDIRLEFIRAVPLSLNLVCHAEKLPAGEKLIEASFCFQNLKPFFNQCATLDANLRATTLSLDDAQMRLQFDPEAGISAALTLVPLNSQVPLHAASCRLANRRGAVRSNHVFVLDLRSHFPQNVNISDEELQFDSRSATSLRCLEEGLGIESFLSQTDQPVVPLQYRWELCAADSLDACLTEERKSVLSLMDFREWPAQIRQDGELYLPFVPSEAVELLKDMHLLCSLGGVPLAFFTAPLNFTEDDAEPSSVPPPLDLPAPRRVELFNSRHFKMHLPCWVEALAPLDDITWHFRRHNDTMEMKLTPASAPKGVTIANDDSSLIFTGPFSRDTEGRYSCVVVTSGQSVTSSFQVSVKRPPRVAASMPSERLVVSGKEIRVPCEFEDAHNVQPGLEVCGEELDLSSWANLAISRSALNAHFAQELLPLRFNVSAVRPHAGQTLTYASGPLKALQPREDAKGPRENSHQVTCVGRSPPFSVRKVVRLRVLPPPSIQPSFPKKVCHGKCALTCNVTALSFYESRGLRAEVRWMSTLLTSRATALPAQWSQWESSGGAFLLHATDAVQRKRIKCDVRLLDKASSAVFFSKAFESADLQLFLDRGQLAEEASVSTIVTVALFSVLIVAAVIFFAVFRWKHRTRQSA